MAHCHNEPGRLASLKYTRQNSARFNPFKASRRCSKYSGTVVTDVIVCSNLVLWNAKKVCLWQLEEPALLPFGDLDQCLLYLYSYSSRTNGLFMRYGCCVFVILSVSCLIVLSCVDLILLYRILREGLAGYFMSGTLQWLSSSFPSSLEQFLKSPLCSRFIRRLEYMTKYTPIAQSSIRNVRN